MAASLADLRREIERSTSLPTFVSIEQRLERIATRLDEEIARPVQAAFDAAPFDDLAQRIDGVRQTLEARPQAEVDANRLEASLKELSVKLEDPNPEPLVALMREINAKLDAAGQRDIQGSSIEPLLEISFANLTNFSRQKGPSPHSTYAASKTCCNRCTRSSRNQAFLGLTVRRSMNSQMRSPGVFTTEAPAKSRQMCSPGRSLSSMIGLTRFQRRQERRRLWSRSSESSWRSSWRPGLRHLLGLVLRMTGQTSSQNWRK